VFRYEGLVKFKTSISSVLVIACCSIADVSAQALLADINADNPPVPELAPGSARVRAALVDSGVNYLLPEIADQWSNCPARNQNRVIVYA